MNCKPGILADFEIKDLCSSDTPMLSPFCDTQEGKPSYGLSSAGYDLRLGNKFIVQGGCFPSVLDPLKDSSTYFVEGDHDGDIFYLSPHSHALAEIVELFNMPNDVTGLVTGKSSYARLGLLTNGCPVEPGWEGQYTLALYNLSNTPIALHVGQGIAQVVFFRGERPQRTYSEKEAGGAYQGNRGVTLPQ